MLDQYNKQRKKFVYSSEEDNSKIELRLSINDRARKNQNIQDSQRLHLNQLRDSLTKEDFKPISYRSAKVNPEVIYVESKSLQLRSKVGDYTEMTDTVKPNRYKSFLNDGNKKDYVDETLSSSSLDEQQLAGSMTTIKKPPRPNTVRNNKNNVEPDERPVVNASTQAKYILMKYLMSEARQ